MIPGICAIFPLPELLSFLLVPESTSFPFSSQPQTAPTPFLRWGLSLHPPRFKGAPKMHQDVALVPFPPSHLPHHLVSFAPVAPTATFVEYKHSTGALPSTHSWGYKSPHQVDIPFSCFYLFPCLKLKQDGKPS